MRPIRWVSEGAWHNELRWLMENNGGRWAAPSTGFTAVDMAIRCLPTDTLVLVGFDATTPDKDGWGDHTGNWPANLVAGHNFALEKQAIAQLRDDGRWLFESMPVAVEWPGAPC
jgi:hypothetical protein